MNDVDRYRAKFDEMGEERVRELYELGRFNAFKRGVATNWLSERERASSERSRAEDSAFAREANEIAREANSIAKAATRAAIVATIISAIALMIALL